MRSLPILLSISSVAQCISLWDPTGPYHVGYKQHIFEHITPNDTTKPGTFMLATIYYPTTQAPSKDIPYLDPILAGFYEKTINLTAGSLSELTTRLQLNAPTLHGKSPEFGTAKSPYPTLFFTPGAGPTASSYTSFLSELASTGYSIIAIDHPGEPPYLALPEPYNGNDGIYGYPNFSNYPPTNAEIFSTFDFRVSDVLAAISDPFIPSFVRKHNLPINLTHIGVFGHSLGGAASAEIMARDKRFKVGLNIDGSFIQLFTPEFNLSSTPPADLAPRPFLEISSEYHFDGNESNPNGDVTFKLFNDAQTGWLRNVQVNGTGHYDCTDIPLWIDRTGQRGRLNETTASQKVGPLGGVKGTEIVSELLKKFFGSLMGESLVKVDELVKESKDLFLLRAIA